MRIFVTGATGVIGRRLIPQLVRLGHSVTAIGRSAESRERLRVAGATPSAVDLFAPDAVRDAARGHDAVINLATSIPPSSRALRRAAWRENDRVRRIVSGHLVDAALSGGAQRFIQESFAPIYPDRGDEWIDESVPVRPAAYNRSVLDAEAAAERFTRNGRIGVVLRFAFFYGPDGDFTRDMIRFVRKGWAPVLGSPQAFMSSVSHDDAATAVIAALSTRAGIYNVVDDEPLRRREYYDSLATALGVEPPKYPPAWLARFAGSVGETLSRSQRISNRRFREHANWRPAAPSAREGWRRLVVRL